MATNIFQTKSVLYFTTSFYVAAGANHFFNPDFYTTMMPSWFIQKELLNYVSGVFEIVFGVFLLFPEYRKWGVWGILGLLMSFWTIHISHLFEPPVVNVNGTIKDFTQKPLYYFLYFRILLHCFLIWWAWQLRKIR